MNARLFVAIFDSSEFQDVDNSDMRPLIRQIRDAQHMTGEQLGTRAGISRSYVTEIEQGKKYPNTRRLEAIAGALGVRIVDLYEQPDSPPKLGHVIEGFSSLSNQRQQVVVDLIDSLVAVSEQEQ